MAEMFEGVDLSTQNYDSLLCGWSQLNLSNSVMFSGGYSTYCNCEEARQYIIDTFNWIIEDDGLLDNNCNETEIYEPFFTKIWIKKINILGREVANKGFQLEIYNDGSIEKKYIIK